MYPARQLQPDAQPRRQVLVLPGGYETPVYVHAARPGRVPVLYVHGIQSHPGWFVGSAGHLASKGWPVFQVTRRGSGENRRDRGHAASAGQLLDDTAAAVDFALASTAASRVHLVGVSWGGKLLAAYVATRGAAKIASLTLVAPGIVPRIDVPAWTKAAIGVSLVACPRKRFVIPLNDVSLFTDNEQMRQYLRTDPDRLLWATARFFWASRQLDRTLARAPRGAIAVATTLILAGRDRIIDNDATRRAVDSLTEGAASVVTLDGSHTLEFESNAQPLYDSLVAALDRADRA